MGSIKTRGIILKKYSLLNKDQIVTIFGEETGLIRVFGKHVKTKLSRRSFHLQTGNLVYLLINESRSTFYLSAIDTISAFKDIKQNLEKVHHVYSVFFILEKVLTENTEERELFLNVIQYLSELSKLTSGECLPLLSQQFIRESLLVLGYPIDEHISSRTQELSYIEEIIGDRLPFRDII